MIKKWENTEPELIGYAPGYIAELIDSLLVKLK